MEIPITSQLFIDVDEMFLELIIINVGALLQHATYTPGVESPIVFGKMWNTSLFIIASFRSFCKMAASPIYQVTYFPPFE